MKILIILFSMGLFAQNNLTLDEAFLKALKNSPKIKALKEKINTQRFSGKSETKYPNPELSVEVSDFLGTNTYSGFDSSVLSLGVSQEILLGGKNNKLRNLSDQKIQVIKAEIKKERIKLKYNIKKIFTELKVLNKYYKLALENKKISMQILETVKNKKESGAISSLEVLKAKIEYKNSRIETDKLKNQIELEENQLLLLIGDSNLKNIHTDIKLLTDLPELRTINSSADIKIQKEIIKTVKKELIFENSNKIPDITFNLEANRYNEAGDYSFTAGISIPLPVWNLNKNKIKSVKSEIVNQKYKLKSIEKEFKQKMSKLKKEMISLKNTLLTLKTEIIPLAEDSLKLAQEGYKEGEFAYLELLDAQKTLILIKKQYIDELSRFNFLILEAEYITGE